MIAGVTIKRDVDEATGLMGTVIIEHKEDLHPQIVIVGEKKEVLASYSIPAGAHVIVEEGQKIRAGALLAKTPRKVAKTKDITGGLPRVAELFEARRPREAAIMAETSGTIRFGRDYKNKRRVIIEPADKEEEPKEYLIPKGKHIHLQDGDIIEKGDSIVEGNPAPHDILAIKGVEELAAYLVNEIQDVYRLQGVAINDKHIEVIVRQMLQKVEIDDAGETDLIQGEQIDRIELDEINARAKDDAKKPAVGHPVLLGITKASLQTRSFISAASFQETTRVLTEAAVNGKVDTLEGLKENVIVGRLIPAGTGAMMNGLREVAGKRDALILEEREKEAAAKAAAAEAPEPAQLPAAE
jgi:DNA-directed RNA polymerase subunit beta'